MTQPISIRLEDQNKANVDHFAKITKRSRSFIINEAVEAYMQDRIKYFNELDEAIEEVHSGAGHSSENIHKWMKSWGTKDELPPPSTKNLSE